MVGEKAMCLQVDKTFLYLKLDQIRENHQKYHTELGNFRLTPPIAKPTGTNIVSMALQYSY